MNQNPPTDLELDEIATRAAHLYEYVNATDDAAQPDFDQLTGTDVPALLAEVRRLRDRVTELERIGTPRTPRICECGHSHLSHTVPAPHSCFAYGQTCECPAYRQMSREEALAHVARKQAEYAERAAAPASAVAVSGGDQQ